MVLSDVDIRRYMERGKIRVSPDLPDNQFGSCSVDFRLGSEFSVFDHSRHPYIDLRETGAIQDIMRTIHVKPGEPFILQPREFALAITEETLELDDDVLGRLEGRSVPIQPQQFLAQPLGCTHSTNCRHFAHPPRRLALGAN